MGPNANIQIPGNMRSRHCAFCLVSVSSADVKLCSGCLKRAYCSKQCQVADWTSKKNGQGHKNWCKLGCGEEDMDWEVSSVPAKGLGLIAMRHVPQNFVIMVDAIRSMDHPGIEDLMPARGTTNEKFALNSLNCGPIGKALCLRIARANHRCNSNASFAYDTKLKVNILLAERDIQQGEEICIFYDVSQNFRDEITTASARLTLQNKWGIICSEDCLCRDEEISQLILKTNHFDSEFFRLLCEGNSLGANSELESLMEVEINARSSMMPEKLYVYDNFRKVIMLNNILKINLFF